MSSATNTVELVVNQEQPNITEQGTITIKSHNKVIIENKSNDVTISKCDSQSKLPVTPPIKTQVLPLVVIQKSGKVPAFASLNANNNIVQLAKVRNYKNSATVTNNQKTLIVPKSGSKITNGSCRYFLKPIPTEKVMEEGTFENIIVSKNGFLKTASSKFVLASMPKLTSNRLPVTATTNSSVQPKLAILPMPVPNNSSTSENTNAITKIQIKDGKIEQPSTEECIKVMCEPSWPSKKDVNENIDKENNIAAPVEKNDVSNKSYELSIAEESLSNHSEGKLVISTAENESNNKSVKQNNQKFSHGVSILKKNYNTTSDKRVDNKSDSIEQSKPSDETSVKTEADIVVAIPPKPERERRRKPQVAVRKDFDDMEIAFLDEPKPDISGNHAKTEVVEKPSKSKMLLFDIKNNFDCKQYMKWNDNVGTVQGSKLKFVINEFNLMEVISNEYSKSNKSHEKKKIEKPLPASSSKAADLEEEVCCVECGCFGVQSDFISPKFCTFDCQDAYLGKPKKEVLRGDAKVGKKRKKLPKSRSEGDIKQQENESYSEDEIMSNASQDKFNYPWGCKTKGFSWSKYLEHIKAKSAPVKLFKDPFPYGKNGFRPSMKLEGIDPQHPSYFCVLTVAEVIGYRMRLHFDGYPENYDFWVNADSMDIFPVGWCEKYGHVLHPPPSYTVDNFNWVQYLKSTKSSGAPKQLFNNRAGQAICPNGFRVGMKLEAVDRKNTQYICVATVRDTMDNRILVHFDSWDDIYDYWADPTSPYIHPVGWCDQYGHNLTPPNGKKADFLSYLFNSQCFNDKGEEPSKHYPSPDAFSWEEYLKETKSVAAPVRAFKQRPSCGFKRGMRLECVDRRVPHLIRVATVDDVKEHQVRIHFDGWLDRYSYWVDDDSPDIHPVGWCQKTGHPLESPLTPDDVYGFPECSTVGCRGQGHIRGPKYQSHSVSTDCPYSQEHLDFEKKVLPDRLLSPDRSPAAVVPVTREPKECKIKPKLGRPPKHSKPQIKTESSHDDEPQPAKKPKIKIEPKEEEADIKPPLKLNHNNEGTTRFEKARTLIERSKTLPGEKHARKKHSKFLNAYLTAADDPVTWTNDDVVDFVSSIPGCDEYTEKFKYENIDGEALIMLNQRDIVRILKFKMGPAVKLYNSIVLLRGRCKRGAS